MSKIRGRDTKPEIALRRALRGLGLGYRVGMRPLPDVRRTGDVVFPAPKVVVMVDGCFWHGCPEHYRPSTQRAAFWGQKVEQNINRDLDTNRILESRGWLVIRVWEHEEPIEAARKIALHVLERRQQLKISKRDGL
ncbi:very short patch repair endonuclease [Arthrobacter ramosus]|uniref:very short patch repair endonuclease n=1 Tax=Arthrobacter ramosus TaxID=1672 RepID=UPI001F3D1FB6|nr:very short patch repair endonuclease [Arthrobacter ramosus]